MDILSFIREKDGIPDEIRESQKKRGLPTEVVDEVIEMYRAWVKRERIYAFVHLSLLNWIAVCVRILFVLTRILLCRDLQLIMKSTKSVRRSMRNRRRSLRKRKYVVLHDCIVLYLYAISTVFRPYARFLMM